MYLNQYWKDERLSFSPEEDKVLTLSGDFAEKIWVPDTFFANDKNRQAAAARKGLPNVGCIILKAFFLFQLSSRCNRAKQNGSPPRWWCHHLWHEVHNHFGMHDGLTLLSARLTKLYRGNRKLWVVLVLLPNCNTSWRKKARAKVADSQYQCHIPTS